MQTQCRIKMRSTKKGQGASKVNHSKFSQMPNEWTKSLSLLLHKQRTRFSNKNINNTCYKYFQKEILGN